MKGLRAAFGRFLSRSPETAKAGHLPQHVCDYLAQQDTRHLQEWLQQLLQANPDAPEWPILLGEARRLGWQEKDIEKLEIFGYFYRGHLAQTFQLARNYAGGTEFDADMFIIAIFSLYYLGQFDDAWGLLKSAGEREGLLEGRADYAIVAALISQAANHLDEMKRYIDLARHLTPNDSVAALNAYAMYFELGEMEAFEQLRQEFQQGRYSIEQAGFALAVIELAQDNYEEGFRFLELRYQMAEAHRYLNRGLFDLPRWQDGPFTGKTLLVSAEQGLGDTIQMARYLPELVQLGAGRVVMETQPETLSLLQYNFPGLEFVERKYGTVPALTFDLWTGSMSLPHLLDTTTENVPGCAGYLAVPPDNTDYWRARIVELTHGERPRIGLAWSGQPAHRADRRRSIPFQRMMEAIREIDADFFALQTHVPPDHPDNLINVSGEMVTLADTAALIAEMDLVITVDTSVVHVAGAIGKETWLLLPYRYEWRWGLTGESNHWYDSVRVLRQKTHGDWNGLLNEVTGKRLAHWRGEAL